MTAEFFQHRENISFMFLKTHQDKKESLPVVVVSSKSATTDIHRNIARCLRQSLKNPCNRVWAVIATAIPSVRLSVGPSLRLSHAGLASRRMKIDWTIYFIKKLVFGWQPGFFQHRENICFTFFKHNKIKQQNCLPVVVVSSKSATTDINRNIVRCLRQSQKNPYNRVPA